MRQSFRPLNGVIILNLSLIIRCTAVGIFVSVPLTGLSFLIHTFGLPDFQEAPLSFRPLNGVIILNQKRTLMIRLMI